MNKPQDEATITRSDSILGYLAIKDERNLIKKVEILDRFGFLSQQIALICGVTEGSVRNARMGKKKQKKETKNAR